MIVTARDRSDGIRRATPRLWRGVAASAWFYRALTLVIGAVAWEVSARSVESILIPTFSETVIGFFELGADPRLWEALFISNQALVVGFLIALAIGVPLGLAIGRFPTLEKITNVYLNILLVAPMAAIIPLLIMSLGLGFASRVVLIVLFAILVMVINARTGVRQVDPKLIEMARSFGASEVQVWQRILLPECPPGDHVRHSNQHRPGGGGDGHCRALDGVGRHRGPDPHLPRSLRGRAALRDDHVRHHRGLRSPGRGEMARGARGPIHRAAAEVTR